MLKILIRMVPVICMVLLPISSQAQQVPRPALLTSMPVAMADLPVQSGRTGSLVLLGEADAPVSGIAQTPEVASVLARLQSGNVPFVSGDYTDLQQTLQLRDLLFWQLPVWTVIISLLSALVLLVLLLVASKESGLPLLRWLFGFALAGNLYYLPAALALPTVVQLTVNAVYFLAILLFMVRLRQPSTGEWQIYAGLAHTLFQATLLLLMVLLGVDTLIVLAGLDLANHPGLTLQLVPIGQVAGVLAALYFLTGRHADIRAELQSLNASLDQRVAQATAEYRIRYRDLARDALRAARMNERRGIYQTIHEDLGDKLLQLIYSADDTDTSDLARSALAELRDSRNLLPNHQRPLTDVLADIRSEAQNRCDQAGIALSWQQESRLPDWALNARQHSALSRTVREAFSNLLKHAQASAVVVNVACQADGRLHYSISDNGKGMSAHAAPGRGLINMRSRVTELGGTLVWSPGVQGGTLFEFLLPLGVTVS